MEASAWQHQLFWGFSRFWSDRGSAQNEVKLKTGFTGLGGGTAMWDITLESVRASVIGLLLGYAWWRGKREQLHLQKGWLYVIAGFALIFLGSVVDITDNFDGLNAFVIIGDTEYQAFLEKVVGYLLGSLLLFVGFRYWLPIIGDLRKAEIIVKQHNQELEGQVQARTAALTESNERLQWEVGERLRTEERLRASLGEKEILLKEIHHRVKNNLQIIYSLLSLQSDLILDEQTLELFKDSKHRIRSMALIHEKLYRSEDLARIDFGEYVNALTSDLLSSYSSNPTGLNLKLHVNGVHLSVDTAVPCGLMLNELFTNSLKYAFPDGQDGEINIELLKNGGEEFRLVIGDNGIGIPEEVDFRNTKSLGLQLVNSLAAQLDGAVELDRTHGTTFTITFMDRGR